MPRPHNRDLSKPWKIHIPATIAGRIEYMLLDPIHSKPIYSSRNRLIVALLSDWIAVQQGTERPHIPTLDELRRA